MKRLALTFALVLPMTVACGGTKTAEGQITPGGPVVEYPEWVNKGSGAFGGEKKVMYGVGSGGSHNVISPHSCSWPAGVRS